MEISDAIKLHPQIIEKEGKNEFIALPYKEDQALVELMHDYADLRDLREAKEESKTEESIPLEKVISDL